jgi:hypothetical protein
MAPAPGRRPATLHRSLSLVGGVTLAFATVAGLGGLAGAAPTTEEFDFTGEAEPFVVPANVCQLTIDVFGAQGGNAGSPPGVGGRGGRATATLSVTPGEALRVTVGGQGDPNTGDAGGLGGFPDGGNGGTKGPGGQVGGAGGGGSSDISRGSTRLVVAGGGGGGGFAVADGSADAPNTGGAGGGATGANGEFTDVGGEGATQSAGGAGGNGNIANGEPGTASNGGNGAGDGTGGESGGGGGGGGLFGGGGGARYNLPDGRIGAGGGGGGSGFTPDGSGLQAAARDADGTMIIEFDPEAGSCAAPPVVLAPRFTG